VRVPPGGGGVFGRVREGIRWARITAVRAGGAEERRLAGAVGEPLRERGRERGRERTSAASMGRRRGRGGAVQPALVSAPSTLQPPLPLPPLPLAPVPARSAVSLKGASSFRAAAISRLLPDEAQGSDESVAAAPGDGGGGGGVPGAAAAAADAQQQHGRQQRQGGEEAARRRREEALVAGAAAGLTFEGFQPAWHRPRPAVLTPSFNELRWLQLPMGQELLWDSTLGEDPGRLQVGHAGRAGPGQAVGGAPAVPCPALPPPQAVPRAPRCARLCLSPSVRSCVTSWPRPSRGRCSRRSSSRWGARAARQGAPRGAPWGTAPLSVAARPAPPTPRAPPPTPGAVRA
jgi:hypothetical protein